MFKFYKYLLLALLFFLSFYGPYVGYINHVPYKDNKILNINPGDSINQTFSKLDTYNFVQKTFINYYLIKNKIKNIQAGEYQIKDLSIIEIINIISNGETITYKLKIVEGTNIYQLENLINESHLINDCSFLSCIETNYGFTEGILYPDTYFYKKGMLASNILIYSNERLNNKLDEILLNDGPKNSLSKEEILILASIVEKEAGNDEEKNLIADVFLTRLSIGMRLQADPTIIYGLLPNFDGDIKKSDILDKNNKFNTYMIKGLPPSPISISSISSISATVNATPGEYLYFVAESPYSHYFSKTYEEHLQKINELGLNK